MGVFAMVRTFSAVTVLSLGPFETVIMNSKRPFK